GCERFARNDRRCCDPQDQDDKTDIENGQNGHPCDPRCRTAPAMSCVTIAPDNWTSSQMLTSFNAPNSPFACGNRPKTTSPRPRLSTLVSACRRVSESGKRIKPTVPAKKKNPPAETRKTVKMSNARFIRRSLPLRTRSPDRRRI